MADKKKANIPETEEGTIVFNVPFPDDLSGLKKMTPIIIKQPYQIDYIHSYGQDSPFFAGLANKKLLGTKCTRCGYSYATPKLHCMECGSECDWIELPHWPIFNLADSAIVIAAVLSAVLSIRNISPISPSSPTDQGRRDDGPHGT